MISKMRARELATAELQKKFDLPIAKTWVTVLTVNESTIRFQVGRRVYAMDYTESVTCGDVREDVPPVADQSADTLGDQR